MENAGDDPRDFAHEGGIIGPEPAGLPPGVDNFFGTYTLTSFVYISPPSISSIKWDSRPFWKEAWGQIQHKPSDQLKPHHP